MRRARQVVYSVGELAGMAGVSKFRMAGLLSSNGVKLRRSGAQGKRVVYVSDVEQAMPELVDSVRFRGGGEDE